MVFCHLIRRNSWREMIYSARTYSRRCLATENKSLRKHIISLLISTHLIVESYDIKLSSKTIGYHGIKLIHTASHRSCRIFLMIQILKPCSHFKTTLLPLRWHLISYAPHHDRRIIAVMMYKIHHVSLCPDAAIATIFIKPTMISVLAFRYIPLIKILSHHHKAHFITKLNKLLSWHIMRCTDSITSHIL